MKLKYILTICDFILIFGLTVSALYVIILVGYIVKMSLRWDIVTSIFPRPFISGLIASMAYTVKKHLTRVPPIEVRPVKPPPKVAIPESASAILKAKSKKLYQQILTHLQTRPKESRKIELKEIARAKNKEREHNVLKLISEGKNVYEIGLRLLMDPAEVEETIASLIRKGHLSADFQLTKT